MRVALAANGRMGLGLIRALQDSEHEVVALVRDGRQSRGVLRWADTAAGALGGPWTVEGRAVAGGVPMVWLRTQAGREITRLAAVEPDLLLLGNFGIILRPPVLAVPRVGVVNVHWSLLPAHRGPNPSTSVLLAGEAETGVTFHVVDERIDAGPILDQQAFPIGPDDTATALYNRAAAEAERRVVAVLDRIEREGLVGRPQDLAAGSYHRRVDAAGAVLDFAEPAAVLDRKVRALSSPMARFRWRGRTVLVSAARPVGGVDKPPGEVVSVRPAVTIACGQGALALDTCWQLVPPAPWPAPWQRIRIGDHVG